MKKEENPSYVSLKKKTGSDSGGRRKKITPRTLFFMNGFILVIMFVLYQSKEIETGYESAVLEKDKMLYRFSMSRDKKSTKYIFFVSVKSQSDRPERKAFTGSIFNLKIKCSGNEIINTNIGGNIETIYIKPGEYRSFNMLIEPSLFDEFAKNHDGLLKPEIRTILPLNRPYLPLNAELRINFREKPEDIVLKFRHEVLK
ncbi:MAG: hypothetical protein MUD12_08520 [Spirochaetes bacterium]|jgi:hypothetical protein|nr:hypothetical protein [Spirochaetota bacterium]